ncbi:MAG TPA: DoxX family protein [Anditalea sp.]|nr:DoxX family protein [Anditalea sp.]
MHSTLAKVLRTDPDATTILIRLMVGAVFLSEGIQKYLFPELRGAGRFEKIGLPNPEFLGYFVGLFEILCGLFILIGLLTRLSAIPTLIIMIVAFATTKSEILANEGFWSMMHGSRTDWAMLLGSIFLIIKGGGKWSVDRIITNVELQDGFISKENMDSIRIKNKQTIQ